MARTGLKAAPNEGFWEHVDGALRELHAIFLSRDYARLAQSRAGASAETFAKVLVAAVAFHDAGKAYSEYQKRIVSNSGRWSVPKHEYYSALAFWKCTEGILEDRLRQAATTAIMLHHIATRGPKPLKALVDWKKYKAPTKVSMPSEVYGELVREFSRRVSRDVVDPTRIPLAATKEDVRELLVSLANFSSYVGPKGYKDYALTLFILRPIIVCDCRAAGTARSGSLRVFVRDFPNPSVIRRIASIIS